MESLKFFIPLSQLYTAQLILGAYLCNDHLSQILRKHYQQQKNYADQMIETLERNFLTCLEKCGPSEAAKQNFLLYKLTFNSPLVEETLTLVRNFVEDCKNDDAIKGILSSALIVTRTLFELLENEQTFVSKCHKVDPSAFKILFNKYQQTGMFPILPEIDDQNVENIVVVMETLDIYPAIDNHLAMSLDDVLNFVKNPLSGIEFVYKKIMSPNFAEHFDGKLGAITKNYPELNRFHGEMHAHLEQAYDNLYLMYISESGQLDKFKKKQLLTLIKSEGLNNKLEEQFENFIEQAILNIGNEGQQFSDCDIERDLRKLWHLHWDLKMLRPLVHLLSQPFQRTVRYNMTLSEVVAPGRLEAVQKFLKQSNFLRPGGPLQSLEMATKYMGDILTFLDKKMKELNEEDRPLDKQFDEASKVLTEAFRFTAQKELIHNIIENLDAQITFEKSKNFIKNPLSWKNAGAKAKWAESMRIECQNWLNQYSDAMDPQFEASVDNIMVVALASLSESEKKRAFEGRTNSTERLKDSFATKANEVSDKKYKASRFGGQQPVNMI